MGRKKVEIYTKDFCPYCQRAKELLRIKGVAYIEHVVTGDPERALEMLQRSQCQRIPGIFVDGQLIGGCADLFELDEKGRLDGLLNITNLP
jgi:glutaredoxin 3